MFFFLSTYLSKVKYQKRRLILIVEQPAWFGGLYTSWLSAGRCTHKCCCHSEATGFTNPSAPDKTRPIPECGYQLLTRHVVRETASAQEEKRASTYQKICQSSALHRTQQTN